MYKYKAQFVYCVDGDTIDFDVDLGFHLTNRIRVRLLDIDTPEVRGSEKEQGKIVKKFVNDLLTVNPFVVIETEKTGSFGRWLARVSIGEHKLSDLIRDEFPEVFKNEN